MKILPKTQVTREGAFKIQEKLQEPRPLDDFIFPYNHRFQNTQFPILSIEEEQDLQELPDSFGLELEYTFHGKQKQRFTHDELNYVCYDGLIMLKHDGSVSRPGLEIAFPPMSWDYIRKNKSMIKGPVSRVVSLGGHANHTCGMHVHMDLDTFESDEHINNMVNGIVNSDLFPVLLFNVSGRKQTNYCNYDVIKEEAKIRKDNIINNLNNHHGLFSLTRQTLEFRLFSGCECPEDIIGRIALTLTLKDFFKKDRGETVLKDFIYFALGTRNKFLCEELVRLIRRKFTLISGNYDIHSMIAQCSRVEFNNLSRYASYNLNPMLFAQNNMFFSTNTSVVATNSEPEIGPVLWLDA